jgi:hypothetical protein
MDARWSCVFAVSSAVWITVRRDRAVASRAADTARRACAINRAGGSVGRGIAVGAAAETARGRWASTRPTTSDGIARWALDTGRWYMGSPLGLQIHPRRPQQPQPRPLGPVTMGQRSRSENSPSAAAPVFRRRWRGRRGRRTSSRWRWAPRGRCRRGSGPRPVLRIRRRVQLRLRPRHRGDSRAAVRRSAGCYGTGRKGRPLR